MTKHEGAARGGTNLNRFGQQRSAPGEAPAQETGRLRAAMGLNKASYNVVQVVLDEDAYPGVRAQAASLEYGSRRMAARPLWEQTLVEKLPDMAREFQTAFKR